MTERRNDEITEEQVDWAVAIQRAASTGTMAYQGRPITPAMRRKAQRIMAAWSAR